MKAYWLNNSQISISAEELRAQGVLNDNMPTDPAAFQTPLDELKERNGYVTQDEVALLPDMPNLQEICDRFVDEHFHDEDEVRFVLAGGGVFDIRSNDDRWMRVEVTEGDLIVIPKKRHHRFFLNDEKMIRCVRLFQDASGWVPHYREKAA
jgi:1,2-dihydroxy-3-keto-5-methylthiopentene dioxygenase